MVFNSFTRKQTCLTVYKGFLGVISWRFMSNFTRLEFLKFKEVKAYQLEENISEKSKEDIVKKYKENCKKKGTRVY